MDDYGWWTFTPTFSAWKHIAVTYDPTNAANNPTVYVNGSSVAVTRVAAPSGALTVTPIVKVLFGNNNDDAGMDGKVQDGKVYNRILSASEIAAIYQSRRIHYLRNGLVFHAPLIGAGGLTKFDGTTLGATNYLYDDIAGAIGTPDGSPVGVGNTIQRVR